MATATTTTDALLTVEEFARRRGTVDDPPLELVRGRIVRMNPPRPYHGYVCSRVAVILGAFLEAHDLGYLLTNDSGVITGRNPDTLRGADVAFYSYGRVPKGSLPRDRYLDVPPELVVEVVSPGDRWAQILEKVSDYLNAGVSAVIVVDPDRRNAQVYTPDAPVRLLAEGEALTLPEILPGFSVGVGRFFD